MNRCTAAGAVCALALAAAGCSSSGYSTGGSSSTPNGAANGTTAGGSSLKPTTTPKFGSPNSGEAVRNGTIAVAYRNIAINPGKLRAKVGSTVRWTNFDSVEHNVTSEGGPQSFASRNFGEGGTFEVKLTKPGVIHYLCTIHPASMNGTIEVVP